jgi:hypothetical protein
LPKPPSRSLKSVIEPNITGTTCARKTFASWLSELRRFPGRSRQIHLPRSLRQKGPPVTERPLLVSNSLKVPL